MNPDKQEPQLENIEGRIEAAEQPRTFLDKIRKWANNKAMIAAAVIGLSGAAACDEPAEKDNTELNSNNQNDIYQDCEPFSMCQMMELKDENTEKVVGFSFWYKFPEDDELKDIIFRAYDDNGDLIGEKTISSSLPGTNQFWVTQQGYGGQIISDKANVISEIEAEIPSTGEIVSLENGALAHPDDDAPSIGQ
jgi:hypothetical protein